MNNNDTFIKSIDCMIGMSKNMGNEIMEKTFWVVKGVVLQNDKEVYERLYLAMSKFAATEKAILEAKKREIEK